MIASRLDAIVWRAVDDVFTVRETTFGRTVTERRTGEILRRFELDYWREHCRAHLHESRHDWLVLLLRETAP